MVNVTEEQKQAIRDAAVDNNLPCSRAFQLSVELDLSLREIGRFCNEEGIRVKNCQLGCFP
jgi:hypothetical protein